jgi:predicted phosphate transport protein (TIGR00153 family)
LPALPSGGAAPHRCCRQKAPRTEPDLHPPGTPRGTTIRQIAALPYRTDRDNVTAPVSILLITSRETRRWVLPKGNMIDGLQPHAAAAHEAEEEAGVKGAACPTALGSYRYRKKRKNGASLNVDVDVFPFSVTDLLDEWEEQDQRQRQWFSLEEAAQLVDEPELAELIRRFRASESDRRIAKSGFVLGTQKASPKMAVFQWVQALLPKQGNFFELFEAHALTLLSGSNALARLLGGGPGMADHIQELTEREHEADLITREVLQTVRRTFLTPFDRSAITSLIGSMDDAIDEMQKTAGAIDLYELTEFKQEMKDMAAIIVDCARITVEALPLLRQVNRNAGRLHELTERLVIMEGHADEIHARGLKALYKQHGEANPLRFIVERELFTHLERVVDRFEDVANEIDGLVIDHA